jgi:hypothetical protein
MSYVWNNVLFLYDCHFSNKFLSFWLFINLHSFYLNGYTNLHSSQQCKI